MASVHTNGASNSSPGLGDHDDGQSVASDLSTAGFKHSFKEDLLEAIENIRSPGTFAFNAKFKELPCDLGISVEGVGAISLPLGESDARQIISKSRQAPYGKGSDTTVDTAVRNTLEWPNHLKKICHVVAQQMGISTTVHADMYNMLMYGKGAMFKAHTEWAFIYWLAHSFNIQLTLLINTEKIPNMFGTLVVNLPSTHTSGEVALKHCGEEVI